MGATTALAASITTGVSTVQNIERKQVGVLWQPFTLSPLATTFHFWSSFPFGLGFLTYCCKAICLSIHPAIHLSTHSTFHVLSITKCLLCDRTFLVPQMILLSLGKVRAPSGPFPQHPCRGMGHCEATRRLIFPGPSHCHRSPWYAVPIHHLQIGFWTHRAGVREGVEELMGEGGHSPNLAPLLPAV